MIVLLLPITHLISTYMPVHCPCHRCNGALVHSQDKHNHWRADLKNQMVNQQNVFRLFSPPTAPITGPSSVLSTLPMHLHHAPAALPTRSDGPDILDKSSHIEQEHGVVFSANLNSRSDNITTYTSFDPEPGQPDPAACCSEVPENFSGEYRTEDQEDDPPEEVVFPGSLISDTDKDFPDLFVVKYDRGPHTPNRQEVPHYLLIIYAIVSWLHLQFNLPCIACNALLAFLTCLLMFLNLSIMPPFIMLHSATCTLSIDSRIQ